MNDPNSPAKHDAIERGHEPDAANARLIMLSGGGLVLLMAFVLLLVVGTLYLLARHEHSGSGQSLVAPSLSTATDPPLSADQPRQLHELHQIERQQLNNYEWIDRQAGIARIPIDRAMKILAEKGLPAAKTERGKPDGNKSE
jgi:hypothetical protein